MSLVKNTVIGPDGPDSAPLSAASSGQLPATGDQPQSSLEEIRRNWEGFGRADPLWAICSDESRRNRKWNKEEFFLTGKREIETVLGYLQKQGIQPVVSNAEAMDFGCGVGRLSQALAKHFSRVHGVDIAASMVEQARKWNTLESHCEFHHNKASDLSLFPDNRFDFIYSSIVLQHIPSIFARGYLVEFVRVLKPGGFAVFQLPSTYHEAPPKSVEPDNPGFLAKARRKLALRHRANSLLRTLRLQGNDSDGNQCKMEMHGIPESEVRELIAGLGARVMDASTTNSTDPDFNGNLKFLDKEPESGWVSKQYCITK